MAKNGRWKLKIKKEIHTEKKEGTSTVCKI